MSFLKYLFVLACAAFTLAYFAVWLASPAMSASGFRPRVVMTIYVDRGGDFMQYFENIQEEERGGFFYAIKGICASACTMRLNRACVYPGAKVFFHSPFADANEMPANISAEVANAQIDVLREVMEATYPANIQVWARRAEALESVRMTSLDYTQLVLLGIPDCRGLLKDRG
jgi:hypothetical protein